MSGTRRNGTRKIGPALAGRHAGERSSEDLGQHGGWEDPPRGGADEHAGRHAAPGRSFPGRKTARSRARKAVPAAAIAATLAAGAAAYGIASSGGTAPGSLAAAIASAPPGGYQVSGAGALAHPGPSAGSPRPAGPASSVAPASAAGAGSLTEAIASNMTSSRRVLGNVAKKAAVAQAPKPSAAPVASAPVASATPAASATGAVTKAPATATATALTCDTSSGTLPENVTAIVSFLLAHGYTHNAAAGIAGNIYRESLGNPESVGTGGGGLIGWTPLPSGFVTGNPAADLQTQLAAILTYNQGWAQYIPALNAAASPAAAADVYVTDFERAGIPAAGQREASAESVAAACGL